MRHIDIVIISYAKNDKLLSETMLCLDSLFKSEDPDKIKFHAYVVESNHKVTYDSQENNDIITIHPDVPFGYHKYLNIGRKAGNSEYVVLCNNDLEFANSWATNALSVMERKGVWSAGCCNPNKENHKEYINQGLEFVDGWGISDHITGWCIFQKREIYEHIGDLDETFDFWYCDNDYSMTLQKLGFYNTLVVSSVVFHHDTNNGSTISSEENEKKKRDMTTGASLKFNEKWNIK